MQRDRSTGKNTKGGKTMLMSVMDFPKCNVERARNQNGFFCNSSQKIMTSYANRPNFSLEGAWILQLYSWFNFICGFHCNAKKVHFSNQNPSRRRGGDDVVCGGPKHRRTFKRWKYFEQCRGKLSRNCNAPLSGDDAADHIHNAVTYGVLPVWFIRDTFITYKGQSLRV